MAETKPQTTPENPRTAIREARERRLRLIHGAAQAKTVKVYAGSETLAGVLRHPGGGRFRAPDQPAEWPNDIFTARRIADGSVRTDGPATGEPVEPDATKNPREQAAAMQPKKTEAKTDKPRERAQQPVA